MKRQTAHFSRGSSAHSHELAEHVLKDTSVLEEGNLRVSIESARCSEGFASVGSHSDILADGKVATLHVNAERLRAVESVSIGALSILELQRQDSHADQVASVDALVRLGDHSVDSLEVRALGSPITGGTGAVLVASQDDKLLSSVLVLLSGIEDGHLFARWHMDGSGTDLRHHLVDEADVSESSACHDLIVTSARAIRVEVLGRDVALSEVASGRRILGDLTSRRDVISCDGVSDVQEAVSTIDA